MVLGPGGRRVPCGAEAGRTLGAGTVEILAGQRVFREKVVEEVQMPPTSRRKALVRL